MIEKIGHIKNPLTVIAIFAAIAEISGTGILPFIEASNQGVYIWFLMLFPVLLVGLFFATLNFNHKVLYAPSDYKDESNFLKLFHKATPEEQESKFKEEIDEAKKEIVEEKLQKPATTHKSTDLRSISKEIMATYSLAEKLAITKISKDLKLDVRQDVKFSEGRMGAVIFDGIAFKANEVHAIEVKMITNERNFDHPSYFKILSMADEVSKQMSANGKSFKLHLVAVVGNPDADITKIAQGIQQRLQRWTYPIQLHLWRMADLENEVSNS